MQEQIQPSFKSKAFSYLHLTENAFLSILVIGFFLQYFDFKLAHTIIVISLAGLCLVYFLSAYQPVKIDQIGDGKLGYSELLTIAILPKLFWISCAVSVLGILFYFLNAIGFKEQLSIGAFSISVSLFILAWGIITHAKYVHLNFPAVMRAIPILLLNFYLLLR